MQFTIIGNLAACLLILNFLVTDKTGGQITILIICEFHVLLKYEICNRIWLKVNKPVHLNFESRR